jgi:hypothetical protein
VQAQVEQILNGRFVPNATPKFAGDINGAENLTHRLPIDAEPIASAIKIDQVEQARSRGDELPRHLGRIFAENRFLQVIPLPQANTLAAAEVNGGPNLHDERISIAEVSVKGS